jgi:phosphodiesterase/alkaline phosphatase D-like protein
VASAYWSLCQNLKTRSYKRDNPIEGKMKKKTTLILKKDKILKDETEKYIYKKKATSKNTWFT